MHFAYEVEETLVYRPRRTALHRLVGKLCTVRMRYLGMHLANGDALETFGGVYDVQFEETGEVLCASEHELTRTGERRWMH
jgi:hypothetical protein